MAPARRLVLFSAAVLAVLAAVLAVVLPAGFASAATGSAAGNRVWAISLPAQVHVRADRGVPADQHRDELALCPFCVPGSCVAPEAVDGVTATAPVSKFSDYIFKAGATHGKDAVFTSYGYSGADSQALAAEYEQQAAAQYEAGNFQLGKLDQYGQRITIPIELTGQGAAAGRSAWINTGWMIRSDGSITLNTPFSGFAK